MYIVHFDPSISSKNLGDKIISESITRELISLFPSIHIIKTSTQVRSSLSTVILAKKSKLNIIGGTNLITPNRFLYSQLKLNPINLLMNNKFILFGVGMWQYSSSIDFYSSTYYQKILSNNCFHSVRDTYTKSFLSKININSLNTCCPTLWPLCKKDIAKSIPSKKSDKVIFTLTDYNQSPIEDIQLIEKIRSLYSEVYFWPQGLYDIEYLQSLYKNLDDIKILPSSLIKYKEFLSQVECDYIGTRLHAGIQAMQLGRRSIIISIDNRAAEIAKDTGLPITRRGDYNTLIQLIENQWDFRVNLPINEIELWRESLIRFVNL